MRKSIAAAVVLSLLLLLFYSPPPALGENASQTSQPATSPATETLENRGAGYLPYSDPAPLGSGGLLGAIVRTMFSLAVVLGLLYVTLWAIKRFTSGVVGPSSGGNMRVVGRIYLSPKIAVYFLKLADELLVIGVNAGAISLLTSIKDEQQISRIEDDLKSAHARPSGPAFSRFFDKSTARFQKALGKEDSMFDNQLRTLNEQIGRLKGLARKRRDDE